MPVRARSVPGVMTMRDGDVLKANWENGSLVQPIEYSFAKDSRWNDTNY